MTYGREREEGIVLELSMYVLACMLRIGLASLFALPESPVTCV